MKFIVHVRELHSADYEVEAESAEDALAKVKAGKGEYVDDSSEFNELTAHDQWNAAPAPVEDGEAASEVLPDDELEGLSDVDNAKINKMDRAKLVEILEDHGIQCYDSETKEILVRALKVNVVDGTIDISGVE